MMNTTPMTVEDLFRKYVPERGTPLSQDVIYWANRFGNVIEPNEEEQFRNEMLAKYGVVASDGGNASMGAAPGPGQGISSTAQNIGLGLMGYGQLGFAPGSMVASMVGNAIADQQVDAIADSFGAMSAAAPNASIGIGTVADPEGNISTVSTPATVAAADTATFGTADAATDSTGVSGAADEGSHGADGNNPGADDPSDDTSSTSASDASDDGDSGDSDGDFRHGGAVRRFAEGGNRGRAEMRASPQNPYTGALARGLRSLQEIAAQYEIDKRIPLLGGTSVDELFSLPGAAGLMEDVSYYGPRALINGGNVATGGIGTFRPDPRVVDVADVALTATPLAVLGAKGVGKGAKALEDATVGAMQRARIRAAAAKVPEDTAYDPLRQRMEERGALMYAIKPKGGNWMAGQVEEATAPFKKREGVRQAFSQEEADELLNQGFVRVNAFGEGAYAPPDPINRWIDTKLNKYIRNEMATPEDPVRALAERNVLHYQPRRVYEDSPMMQAVDIRREAGGFPETDLATTDLGKMWERYADYAISNVPAGIRTAKYKIDGGPTAKARLAENPWLEKLPRDTPVYSPDYTAILGGNDNLGIQHLLDELRAAIDPTSDLPANLKLDVNKLDKVTMPQAVELVDKINKWRSAEAAKAEKLGMLGNLKNTPRLESPDLSLSFTEKPGGLWVDLPEAIGDDGKQICTTIGKQGGWCTQHAGTAEHYGAGDNRLVALLDADGRPHVQVQIATTKGTSPGHWLDTLPTDEQFAIVDAGIKPSDTPEYAEWLAQQPKDIIQLKPPANDFNSDRAREYARRDPQYRNKITDSVLQFLNNGNWGKVNDLDQYNIIDLADPHVMLREVEDGWGANGKDIFNAMISADPNAPRFMRRGEFVQRMDEFLPEGPPSSRIGYAGGGLVKALLKSVDDLFAKDAAEETAKAAVKEQKMLQGFYRGYAGDYDAAKAAAQDSGVFVSPQRAVAEYYAAKRAGQTGLDPHLEMILADPFSGRGYGHSTRGTGKNPPMVTRARELAPEDVKDRTQLKAAGGLVNFDRDEIAQIAERAMSGYAAGGLVDYDPDEIGTIVSRVKEEFHA